MELSRSRTSHQGRDSQGVGCFTDDVVGRTGCCMDGMCPESWGRDILSVKKAEMSVPLQLMASIIVIGVIVGMADGQRHCCWGHHWHG